MIFEFNNKNGDGSNKELKCLGVMVKEPESMLDDDHIEDELECSSDDNNEDHSHKTHHHHHHHSHTHKHHHHSHKIHQDSQKLQIGFLYALNAT